VKGVDMPEFYGQSIYLGVNLQRVSYNDDIIKYTCCWTWHSFPRVPCSLLFSYHVGCHYLHYSSLNASLCHL